MYIGYMGDVVFTVAESKLITPSNFQRKGSARWTEHSRILHKPAAQYTGPGRDTISFEMTLSSDYGISPQSELSKLEKMRDDGQVFSLVIGGKPIGEYWYLEELSEGETFFDAAGRMTQARASVTLQEYA
jgi:phage protein U